MDVEKYRQLFLDECREHLQVLNREVLRLEEEGEAFDGIDTIFREAHSIKGMSASMGYDSMVSLSHAMEDLFDGIRKGSLQVSPDLTSLMFDGVDVLGQLTGEVEERGRTSIDVADLVGRLRAFGTSPPAGVKGASGPTAEVELGDGEEDLPAAEVIEEEPAASAPGEEDREGIAGHAREGKTPFRCSISISQDTASISARNFVIIGKLNKVGTIIRSDPPLEEILQGKGKDRMEVLIATAGTEKELLNAINSVPELTEVEVAPVLVEDSALPPAEDPGPGAPPEKEERAAPAPAASDPGSDASKRLLDRHLPRKSTTVRVDTRILDDLINIVGEMIINRDSLLALARDMENELLDFSLGRMDLLVRSFQETIMAVRMMPLEIITDRLPRIVRDLARQKGKNIRLEILGQGIELDRAILEEINDVLIHLVRNAIDHGAEPAEERKAAGKQEKSLVRLSAGRERDWVWIAVEDDGRGMDVEKIRAAALQRGLVSPEKAASMEDHELFLLTCLPGLSTAEQVSDVSGRGVGMDVVRSKVDSLGGTLRIDSQRGAGTRTTLRLPLTLAIVQILLVDMRGQVFGLPVSHVAHTMKVNPGEVEWSQKKAVIRWGGEPVRFEDFGRIAGLPARDLSGDGLYAVLTEHGGEHIALAVDGLAGTYEAVIKPLGLPLKNIPGLAGATVMSDGRTVLVLDLKALA